MRMVAGYLRRHRYGMFASLEYRTTIIPKDGFHDVQLGLVHKSRTLGWSYF